MVSLPHRKSGRRRGFAPSPNFFFDFRQRNGVFWRILGILFLIVRFPFSIFGIDYYYYFLTLGSKDPEGYKLS